MNRTGQTSWDEKGHRKRKATMEELTEFHRLRRLAFPEEARAADRKASIKWKLAHPEQYKEVRRQSHIRNKEKESKYSKEYRSRNPEIYREASRRQRAKYPDRFRERARLKAAKNRKTNPSFRVLESLRGRVNNALRGRCKSARTLQLLGCSIESFRVYLESKFESGMSWQNYGLRGWEIDHIVPCAIFDLSKPDHQKICFHFSNLQPMWAIQNRAKGKKLVIGGGT